MIAPFDSRVKHVSLALAHGAQSGNPDAIRNLVERDDVDKPGRARYLFDSELDDAMLYDLVLNMERLETTGAATMIERLLRLPEFQSSTASAQMVADRGLASSVRAALAATEDTRRHKVDVEASAGVVSLTGTTGLEEAAKAARQVPRGAQRGDPPDRDLADPRSHAVRSGGSQRAAGERSGGLLGHDTDRVR